MLLLTGVHPLIKGDCGGVVRFLEKDQASSLEAVA